MLIKRVGCALFLGLVLLAGGSLATQTPAELMGLMRERLGLTSQQIEAIRELQRKHRETVLPIQEQLRAKDRAFRAALEAAEPNAAAIGQIAIEQHSLRKQLRTLSEKLETDILALLTAEQKQTLERLGLMSLRGGPRRPRR